MLSSCNDRGCVPGREGKKWMVEEKVTGLPGATRHYRRQRQTESGRVRKLSCLANARAEREKQRRKKATRWMEIGAVGGTLGGEKEWRKGERRTGRTGEVMG